MWTSFGEPVADSGTFRIGDYVSADGSVISFINISRIGVQEGGKYECTAINDVGSDSTAIWISVIGAPFIKPMNNVTVVAGNTLRMHCPFSAHHLSSIHWYKGFRALPLNRRQIVFPNGTLVIQSVFRAEDEGDYKCLVTNKDKETFDRTVHVRVIVAPSIATFNFAGVLQEGMRASVTCTVITGDPPIEMRWMKDGKQLTARDGIYLENVDDFISNLIFKPLKQEHSGLYSCVASNGAASVNHTVSLSVDAPPRWRIEPNDKSAIVGHSLTIDCQAYGKPEPRVLWKKMSEESLTVPAHFVEKYKSVKSRKDEKVELNCNAFGESPIHIKWSKDGQSLERSLHQFDLQEQSSNSDLVSKLIMLKVRRSDSEKPDVAIALKAITINSRSLQVKWTKPFDGNSAITKYTLQFKESNEENVKELNSDGHRTDVLIKDLLPLTVYQLRIRAENEIGKSDWSDVLTVTTDEEVPEVAPKHIQVKTLSSKSIHVSWQSKHHLVKVTGFYVGYKKYDTKDSFIFKTVKAIDALETKFTSEINDLTKMSKYVIVVQAYNGKGAGPLSEEVIAETAQFDAPKSPQVKVSSVSSSTINLMWTPFAEEENPIFGYVIKYRKEEEHQWHETQVMPDVTSHSLSAVQCGTTYFISMLAFNTLGRGKQSDTMSVKTRGSVPIAPEKENLIAVNSTYLHLNLNAWIDGDCPIDYFSIQYKPQTMNSFIQLLDEAYLPDKIVPIRNLEPATYYNIWIQARNGAGVTEAQYTTATLTENGDDTSTSDRSHKGSECMAMNEMQSEKASNFDCHTNCEQQFRDEECVYLPAAYASTRIAANSFSCEQIPRTHLFTRNASQSFSNVYDTPQIRYVQ
ncbi:Down syndrome cell adhesion molecule-like protein Dscam2 [Leptotrombidium deliense]|uniref:Down syndrome cell adhesion molecule-like protein Dscam2 n=1 Tax=Leptotrombidium deliense TaxID=299467 RepID=A0A443SIG5_9ACAR|nr:Down syndrome cell adhesion molecule-like protein Dscam2 [Leptotrombidium deliense]